MNELTPLKALQDLSKLVFIYGGVQQYKTIEAALKDYEELSKIENKQNTINDFYPDTKEMINDLLDLVSTKMHDFLQDGKRYTKTALLEILGTAIRYVKTFAYGSEFNENEKVGVNTKKLKVFDLITHRNIDIALIKTSKDYDDYCGNFAIKMLCLKNEELVGDGDGINEEEYNLIKEALK